ncbi:DUF6701 domain-containing protein [uncultured Vibrio sp.]|uniref:DUF6701 domain-containing protein n=1 Tax=uncultured Vibrio sp. TaxID=114054 RepID=UPI002639C2CC|nr:DUF6701 domain-containing protein [uncultured Vibrio sp.]
MFRKLVGVLTLSLLSVSAHAELFPGGTCPSASVQTWSGSGGEVEFKEDSYVRNSAGVGFSSIKKNHDESCGRSACSADSSKILTQSPNFTIPNNAIDIESLPGVPNYISGNKIKLEDWQSIVVPSGIYFSSKEIELKDDSSLRVSGDVVLYVDKFKMKDDSFISYDRGNSGNEFFLVGTDKSHIKIETDSSVYAHIVSDDHVDLEDDVYFTGTITGKKVHLKNDSILNTRLPVNCDKESPTYSTNAKYEFGVKQCTGMPCEIEFIEDYELAPLVFVMPTVRTTDPDYDAPSRLQITSSIDENSSSVWIDQDSQPDLRLSYQEVPMTEISYFIIEPGTVEIDGHKLVAGYVDTNAAIRRRGSVDEATVPYSRFGGEGFNSTPVVLHQLQTNSNSQAWMTSGRRHQGNQLDQVRLFIELSETGNADFNNRVERLAFLASEPSGKLASKNSFIQFDHFNILRQSGTYSSLLDGCRNSTATTALNEITGIIGNKQQRLGSDGGWVRRCEINGNQATFAMDEDRYERSHIPELGGYLAFQKNTTQLPPVCSVTPFAVQSWDHASELTWTSNTTTIQINGTYNSSGAIGIRLDPSNPNTPTDPNSFKQCDSGECVESDNLYISEPDVVSVDWSSGNDFTAGSGNHNLAGGTYNTVSTGGDGRITLTDDVYYIEHLIVTGSGSITLSKDTTLVVNTFTLNGGARFNNNGYSMRLWAENKGSSSASVVVKHSLTADVFSRGTVEVSSGQGVINGRVTAMDVTLKPDGKIINNDLSCPIETSDYEVVLSPEVDIALTCEVITATAKVYNNKVIDTSFNGTVTLSSNGNTLDTATAQSGVATFSVSSNVVQAIDAMASITITGQDYVSNTVNYQFVPERFEILPTPLNLIAGRSQAITISPLECDGGGTPISDTSYLGDSEVSLSNVSYIYPSVPLNSVSIEILDKDGDWISSPSSGVTPLGLTFVSESGKVVANSEIKYAEAGQVTFTLSDKQCITDEDGVEKCKEYTGTKEVKSRPWTFAVCPPSGTTTGGDASGGSKFIAAGETFSLYVKPVVWSSTLDIVDSDSGEALRLHQKKEPSANPFCSLDVTNNFFINNSTLNTIVGLANSLATPSGGELGDAYLESVNSYASTSELEFSNISVTEVGSFHFTASTSNAFYNGILNGIDDGARELGRFYPKYFQTVGTPIWDYPGSGVSEQSFAYMNQPFDGVEFEVEALNALGHAVENYASFDSTLTAGFSLFESNFGVRFNSPVPNKVWTATDNRSIGTFTLSETSPSTDCDSELCLEKLSTANNYEDGPYNGATGNPTDISITHTGSADDDPVVYQDEGEGRDPQRLTAQPDIRFGRIDLDDVGGNSDTTIAIPLRAEYWDSSRKRFVLNDDDSTTRVDASTSASDVIWSEDDGSPTTVALSDGGQISVGESRNLMASQGEDVSIREQVQLWQSMDDTPWLRYDWDSDKVSGEENGEQDPSTVVTFGIYRGNDRVIYRGESGLTGQ